MDYQARYKTCTKGFSLVELVVVIGIFLILAGVSDSVYVNSRVHGYLEVTTANIVEALRHAQTNAEEVNNDSAWGVKISSSQLTIFGGTSYALRNPSLDQSVSFPGGITAGGLSEIVFDKVTGSTSTIGTTTVTNSNGTQNIYINAKGTITY